MVVGIGLAVLPACSSDSSSSKSAPASNATSTSNSAKRYPVGSTTETFTRSDRTLETLVLYPAAGDTGIGIATHDAPPAKADGPFPLIVFAHGFTATPVDYKPLLMQWAAAGYVVVAPKFAKSSAGAPGGPDAGDFANQPADMSTVITETEKLAASGSGPLSGLVKPGDVGAAGHSLGGITTLGLVANTCCRDQRVKAAVVMAGDSQSFPKGKFDYDDVPPILLIHGTGDTFVAYDSSVDVFNAITGPKALLTIKGGDHSSPVKTAGVGAIETIDSTIDFFDYYLKGDRDALARLRHDGSSSATRIVIATDHGAETTVATTAPPPARNLQASVTPNSGLTNNQQVTVTWSGFTPGNTINIVQCSNHIAGDSTACDLRSGYILRPDPTGSGSLPMSIVVGPVGLGTCDAQHSNCDIVFNDGGSLAPSSSVRVPISFAP